MLMVSANAATSPLGDGEFAQIAVGHGGHDFHDAAHLLGEVGGHDIGRVGEILPSADPRHLRLSAEAPFGADLARPASLAGEASGPPWY